MHKKAPDVAPGAGASAQPLRAAEVVLAQCHLDDARGMLLADAWGLLSADEAERAHRFHFDRDRHRYVRGRAFLRSILGQVCGQDPASLIFGKGPQGKPFLPGCDLSFNLSHSRDLAVAALSWAGPLGIDVEFIDRVADIAGLAQVCLTTAEAAVLAALPEAARRERFFAFWTAKEARMKLTGEGLMLPPRQIEMTLVAGLPVGYRCPALPPAQAVFLDLGHDGVLCCLALAQGPRPVITFAPMIPAAHVIPLATEMDAHVAQ